MVRPCGISINSVESNTIAMSIKTRLILTFDHTKVNKYSRKEDVNLVLYTAIIDFYNHMVKVFKRVNNRGNGYSDSGIVWYLARCQWFK